MKRGYGYQRERMVEKQLQKRGISNDNVLKAFLKVERHLFVEETLQDRAYDDSPLPIGKHQTISQPYIVALMTQALNIKDGGKILEIGTGSGYQTAILAVLGANVFTIERHRELAQQSRSIFESMALHSIAIRIGDGTIGWKEYAPYQGIIVTAAAPQLPNAFYKQLSDGGRLVIPIGGEKKQTLFVFTKTGDTYEKEALCPCSFVPLIGLEGWESAK